MHARASRCQSFYGIIFGDINFANIRILITQIVTDGITPRVRIMVKLAESGLDNGVLKGTSTSFKLTLHSIVQSIDQY